MLELMSPRTMAVVPIKLIFQRFVNAQAEATHQMSSAAGLGPSIGAPWSERAWQRASWPGRPSSPGPSQFGLGAGAREATAALDIARLTAAWLRLDARDYPDGSLDAAADRDHDCSPRSV